MKRLLTLSLLANFIVAQRIETFEEATLKKGYEYGPLIYGGVIFIGLVLLFIGYKITTRLRVKKQEIIKSTEHFKELVKRRDINESELNIINELASMSPSNYMSTILTNRDLYNQTVDKYIQLKVSSFSKERQESVIEILRSIRIKNSFHKSIPFKPIRTTKEIEVESKVDVHIGNKLFKSTVLKNEERYLVISLLPEIIKDLDEKETKTLSINMFIENDGHYQIRMNLLRILTSPIPAIYLSHTSKFQPPKKRLSKRAKVLIDIKFNVGSQGDEQIKHKKNTGVITNISSGGLEMHSNSDLGLESFITTDIPLNEKYYFKKIKLKLLKKTKRKDDYTYNLIYVDLSNKLQEQIIKAVNSINREEEARYKKGLDNRKKVAAKDEQ